MTIEQRVERMFNPGGSTPVGTGFPLVPFASLPAASTVEGQVRRLTELPHVSLIALSGKWRPFGGRQVLAQRSVNPVTVQSLSDFKAETIGPFPGGLVRAGMRVECREVFSSGGLGTNPRLTYLYAGPSGGVGTNGLFAYYNNTINDIDGNGEIVGRISVLSDASANHRATPASGPNASGVYPLTGGYFHSTVPALTPLVDFSAPWAIDIVMRSAAETAVAISTATWVGGVATYNTSAVHTLAVGDKTTIAGVDLAGYNGVVIVTSVPTTTQFTAVIADPGGSGTGGTSSRISNMISQSYVLELVG